MAWLNGQAPETLFITATSLAELLLGLETLPAGRRRTSIEAAVLGVINRFFGSRVLPFDQEAARAYAERVGTARSAGRAIAIADGQIAAVAAVKRFSVATRDTTPLIAAGVNVINPWLV